MRSYVAQDEQFTMFTAVCDCSPEPMGAAAKAELEGAKNGILINSGTRLLGEREIRSGVAPGIEFESESGAAHLSVRVFAANGKLYQLIVVTTLGQGSNEALRYLSSFRLIDRAGD